MSGTTARDAATQGPQAPQSPQTPQTPQSPQTPRSPQTPQPRGRRRGRGRKVAGVVAAVAVTGVVVSAAGGIVAREFGLGDFGAGAFGSGWLGLGGSGSGSDGGTAEAAASTLPPATTQVTRQTMQSTESVDGDLGFGPSSTLTNRVQGTVTALPDSGQEIARGRALYKVDDQPVVLMYGELPAYRTLGPGSEGADVKQLERNLKALGYKGFSVDEDYTDNTADAVEEWQEDLGLTETGRVDLGRVVFADGAVRVDTVKVGRGEPAGPGLAVLDYTGTASLVTADLELSDQSLVTKGAEVSVELPDGTKVAGTIDQVTTVIEPAADQNSDPETKLEAVISLEDQKATGDLTAAAVDVVFTASERKDVLTVPVTALVALAEGGYGIEVVTGSTSRYVPVTTGLFSDGRVEIDGAGIDEGTRVGVPK
ncbi:peptidoglycan-binding protein [Actinopolymorpha sp. B17G11]|uniref:peptidoglycan-binding protein n=1 Tax=Actinopolymorpha sp. B17G11 TaxID=3160861 RepID=UPI0032E4A7AD